MYFFKLKGRQMLDLRGDLILTHNPRPVMARTPSAAPAKVCKLLTGAGAELVCFGTTKAGSPRHPLYLPASQPLEAFKP